MNALSFFNQYKAITMFDSVPTLQDTPAKIRDWAISEARTAEMLLAEARQLLENSHAPLSAISLWIEVGPGKILAPDTTGKIVGDLQRGAESVHAFLNRSRA